MYGPVIAFIAGALLGLLLDASICARFERRYHAAADEQDALRRTVANARAEVGAQLAHASGEAARAIAKIAEKL